MSDGGQRPKDDDWEQPISIVGVELGDALTDFAPEHEDGRRRSAVTQDPAIDHLVYSLATIDRRDGLQAPANPPESLDHRRDRRRQVKATTLIAWVALLLPLVVAVDLFTGGGDLPTDGPPTRSAPLPSVAATAPPVPSGPVAAAPATSPAPSVASPTVRPAAPTSAPALEAPQRTLSGAPLPPSRDSRVESPDNPLPSDPGDTNPSAVIRELAPAEAPAVNSPAEGTAIPEPGVAPEISREEATSVEVNRVVRGYAESFNALDIGAMAALWLDVDTGELRRVFRSVHSQAMAFRNCDVASVATSAQATCTGSLTYVPKVGSPKPRVQRVRWEFQMQERSGRWLIESLDAIPMQ